MKRIIYALSCPFTGDVHYIGKSTQGMIRPMKHSKESHSEKVKEWVDSLKELAHKPTILILEYVSIEDNIDSRERYWIYKYLNEKSLLLNSNLVTPILVSDNKNKELEDNYCDGIDHISKFIKERRRAVNITQEEFANKAGVALTVLRKLEQGKTNVNLDGLMHILRMFGSTINPSKINQQYYI